MRHGLLIIGLLVGLPGAAQQGAVAGKITFDGQVPRLRPLPMDADQVCASLHDKPVLPEIVQTNPDGSLRNVFIYVKSGLGDRTYPVPGEPVTLDQVGCVYRPHVIGIRVGQNLRVVSRDNTAHNVHPLPEKNREWNISQAAGSGPIIRSFSEPEVRINVVCNRHPWMRAVIHVVSHPFYAITGDGGGFELKGLPPGEYEIEAVHERYGAITQKVTVKAGAPAQLDFTFHDRRAYVPSALREMPTLVLP